MNAAPVQGMGSGIMVDGSGYILTNNHIVENAEGMVVSMFDGTQLDGVLVGNDPMSDIAVVKVDAGKKKLPVAKLGDSDKIRVGQLAIAIGNPFGFMLRGPTVTVGVISALKRTIQAEKGVYENLFQTDAHINPGNSGGPLINSSGEVIGMNSANIPFAQGIGFSIPINGAMSIAKELIEHGKVIRPWLGILGIGLNKEIAAVLQPARGRGRPGDQKLREEPRMGTGHHGRGRHHESRRHFSQGYDRISRICPQEEDRRRHHADH